MIGPGLAGAVYEAYATGFYSGLVGVLTVQIETSDGDLILGPLTEGIIEIDSGGTFSVYRYDGTFPDTVGDYVLIWTDGDGVQAAEPLEVVTELPDIDPDAPGPLLGPCETWIGGADVASCCGVEVEDVAVFDQVAVEASMALYELSGRQFSGLCSRVVRPCDNRECHHPGSWHEGHLGCGCQPLSEVTLAGYPVREITQVLIDGAIVSPSTYRLDHWVKLVRTADPADPDKRLNWPACQRLDLPSDQLGTFEVSYLYGVSPPPLGQRAAAQLGCELYRACNVAAGGGGDCALPVGATRIERQGVTIDLGEMTSWGRATNGSWVTGMGLVDAFLNTTNPNGIRRRPAMWSPDGPQYAERVGT